jgi:hypothetical protein
MHLLHGVAIQPNLELKTRPKQLLGSLLLVIALPDLTNAHVLSRVCLLDRRGGEKGIPSVCGRD